MNMIPMDEWSEKQLIAVVKGAFDSIERHTISHKIHKDDADYQKVLDAVHQGRIAFNVLSYRHHTEDEKPDDVKPIADDSRASG